MVDYSQHNSVLYDSVCSSKVKKSKLDELDRIIERRKVAHVSSFMLNWQLHSRRLLNDAVSTRKHSIPITEYNKLLNV